MVVVHCLQPTRDLQIHWRLIVKMRLMMLREGWCRADTLVEHVDVAVGLLHGKLLLYFICELTCVRGRAHHNIHIAASGL